MNQQSSQEDDAPSRLSQPDVLSKVRKLTAKIVDYQRKFNKGEYKTYGGAMALLKLRREREMAQADLDPMRVVASGISCRDCEWFFRNDGRPVCEKFSTNTCAARTEQCGPEAKHFEPKT